MVYIEMVEENMIITGSVSYMHVRSERCLEW